MVKVISLPYIFQVLYVFYFTWPRYQVSVYRTIGPLVLNFDIGHYHSKNKQKGFTIELCHPNDKQFRP